MRKRWKRKSGYKSPQLTVAHKELKHSDLFVNSFYNEWINWRDGMRDWHSDFKHIKYAPLTCYDMDVYYKRMKMNKKQKKLIKIRQRRKECYKNKDRGY